MKFYSLLPKSLRLPVIGLDISDRTFKYVKLKMTRDGYEVDFFGEQTIPPGIIESGEIRDAEKLSQEIQKTIGKYKKDVSYVAFALPEEKGFVQLFEIPMVEDEQIRNVVKMQFEEFIPLAPDQTVFDYVPLKSGGAKKHLDVAVSAFPKELMELYLKAVEGAGFAPLIGELESQALARAVVPKTEKGTVMIVDFGFTRTSFFIARDGVVQFTSTVNVSGEQLTRSIAEAMRVSEKTADTLKKSFSFYKKEQEHIFKIIQPSIELLQNELKRRIDFWGKRGRHAEKGIAKTTAVEKVYLSGGDSHMIGLPEYLGDALGVSVERARPVDHIFNLKKYIPPISAHDSLLYATAFGLALRGEE